MMTFEHDGISITIDDDGIPQLSDAMLTQARSFAVAKILAAHQLEFTQEFASICSTMLAEQIQLFEHFKETHGTTKP